jgi:transposase-like protein
MQCPTCRAEGRKFGKDRHGNQRFQCMTCRKTFSERPARPLGTMRLDTDKALQVLQLLLEGMSVRATMRVRSAAHDAQQGTRREMHAGNGGRAGRSPVDARGAAGEINTELGLNQA